jgi:hypothetical protein
MRDNKHSTNTYNNMYKYSTSEEHGWWCGRTEKKGQTRLKIKSLTRKIGGMEESSSLVNNG